jgi:hypothetical protein
MQEGLEVLELSVLLRLPNYEFAFRLQKAIAKLLNDAFYAILCREIKKLAWSDPEHPRQKIEQYIRYGLSLPLDLPSNG